MFLVKGPAINHTVANRLLGMIIRWLNFLCKHETKVVEVNETFVIRADQLFEYRT